MSEYDKEVLTQKLAKRIYNFVGPWDRDYEEVEDIVKDINEDPLTIIEYLMDMLEGA